MAKPKFWGQPDDFTPAAATAAALYASEVQANAQQQVTHTMLGREVFADYPGAPGTPMPPDMEACEWICLRDVRIAVPGVTGLLTFMPRDLVTHGSPVHTIRAHYGSDSLVAVTIRKGAVAPPSALEQTATNFRTKGKR